MIPMLAAGGLMIMMGLALWRLFAGPTLHDRLLAAHLFAIGACVLLAALAVAARRPDWVDAGIAFALAAFVAAAASCKFLRYRSFQSALAPSPAADSEGANA
jgi:multicomponent Na+:H+ antiporter subunit F